MESETPQPSQAPAPPERRPRCPHHSTSEAHRIYHPSSPLFNSLLHALQAPASARASTTPCLCELCDTHASTTAHVQRPLKRARTSPDSSQPLSLAPASCSHCRSPNFRPQSLVCSVCASRRGPSPLSLDLRIRSTFRRHVVDPTSSDASFISRHRNSTEADTENLQANFETGNHSLSIHELSPSSFPRCLPSLPVLAHASSPSQEVAHHTQQFLPNTSIDTLTSTHESFTPCPPANFQVRPSFIPPLEKYNAPNFRKRPMLPEDTHHLPPVSCAPSSTTLSMDVVNMNFKNKEMFAHNLVHVDNTFIAPTFQPSFVETTALSDVTSESTGDNHWDGDKEAEHFAPPRHDYSLLPPASSVSSGIQMHNHESSVERSVMPPNISVPSFLSHAPASGLSGVSAGDNTPSLCAPAISPVSALGSGHAHIGMALEDVLLTDMMTPDPQETGTEVPLSFLDGFLQSF